MNSQANRNVKASSATTTRFIPARKTGKNGKTRRRAAEIDDDQKKRGQPVEPEMRADPRNAERQHQRRRGIRHSCMLRRDAVKAGRPATKMLETMGLAIYMRAGPAVMQVARAVEAFAELSGCPASA